ncbi:hypothetical protein BDR22DRAFT_717331 [Usnea florida]
MSSTVGRRNTSQIRRPTFNSIPDINAQIHAPFDRFEEADVRSEVENFTKEAGLEIYGLYFEKGAFIAQNERAFEGTRDDGLSLTAEEKESLERETMSRWRQPRTLWQLVILCAIGAATQGWDESAVDGGQTFYIDAFGITGNQSLIGLVASAPYLCCIFSCWLTQPLNAVLGRRGTIFLACLFSIASCLLQAISRNWRMMVGFRILLGVGIGLKSATIPIYTSECAPAKFRGALVMFWQFFTALGIMLGYICDAIFRGVLDGTNGVVCPQPSAPPPTVPKPEDQRKLLSIRCSLNWRIMVAAPMIPPILLAMYIFTQPESPRWLLAKAHKTENKKTKSDYYKRTFYDLTKLRNSELLAARDMILMHYRLRKEEQRRQEPGTVWYRRGVYELFAIGRNRRALTASLIVMFFQQFCGINVLIYYSSSVLLTARYPANQALLWSMGVGIINFAFAAPAFFTIDRFGRRNLLLVTFPFLALFQLLSAIAFQVGSTRLIIAGLYLFAVAYSPGEGSVPFVYSAESMPLYIRDLGMGLVTSVLWLFYFIIGITWPSYVKAFTPFGAFMWYCAWCIIALVLIYFLVPETKGKELEDLDETFSISSKHFARFHRDRAIYAIKVHVFRQGEVTPPPSPSPIELTDLSNPEEYGGKYPG